MASGPILFINPNSTEEVTEGIRAAVAPYVLRDGPAFECVTITESPSTIMTDDDVAFAAGRLADLAESRPDASAIVICCFSDPGLALTRSRVRIPVIGCQEAGIMTALMRARKFGIVALSPKSIPRHMRRIEEMGVASRLAAEEGLDFVSALDAGTSDAVFADTVEIGKRLIAAGAGALVPGCAGFAPRRRQLESVLGIPVVDPVQAAAVIALGAVAG